LLDAKRYGKNGTAKTVRFVGRCFSDARKSAIPHCPFGRGISKKLLDAKTVRFCGKVFVMYNLTPSFGRGEVISKKLKKENT